MPSELRRNLSESTRDDQRLPINLHHVDLLERPPQPSRAADVKGERSEASTRKRSPPFSELFLVDANPLRRRARGQTRNAQEVHHSKLAGHVPAPRRHQLATASDSAADSAADSATDSAADSATDSATDSVAASATASATASDSAADSVADSVADSAADSVAASATDSAAASATASGQRLGGSVCAGAGASARAGTSASVVPFVSTPTAQTSFEYGPPGTPALQSRFSQRGQASVDR